MSHTFYCRDQSGKELRLGPGVGDGHKGDFVLRFRRGWAYVDDNDEHLADYIALAAAERNYTIEYLGPDAEQTDPDAAGAVLCDICGKSLVSKFAWTGHMRSHSPKG